MTVYNKNIKGLYLSSFFSYMFFDRALWTIYLIERGISTVKVGIVESILHLSILLFEIPTGIVADIYGKRVSLIFSRVLYAIYAIGMMFASNFYFFSILFILMGIGSTFGSGSDTALLYDSIESEGESKEKEFIKLNGFYGSVITTGLALGMFLGGIFHIVSWKFLYALLATVQLISILPLIQIREKAANKDRTNDANKSFKCASVEILNHTRETLKRPLFLILTCGIILFTASINAIYIFIPIWFKDIGMSELIISSVFAIDSIVSIIVYSNVHRIENKININKLVLFPPAIALVCLIALPCVSKNIALILFIIINNMAIFFYPLSQALVNKRIESNQRATVLSTISFMGSFIIMILFPLMGYLSKYFKVGNIIATFSIFSAISFLLLVIFNNQRKREKIDNTICEYN